MEGLIQLLGSVSAGAMLGWVVAVFLAAVAIYKWVEKYRKARNNYDQIDKMTHDNSVAIQEIKKAGINSDAKNKQHFQALEAKDKEILQKIDKVTDSIEDLHLHQKNIEAYQKQKDVAELKNTIEHAYKAYLQRGNGDNSKVFITENQEEILKDLINTYEKAGGDSFVHTKVIPALASWEVITEKEFEQRIRGGR